MPTCNRCGYRWIGNWKTRTGKPPVRCARCRTQYWNKPRQRKIYVQDKRLKSAYFSFQRAQPGPTLPGIFPDSPRLPWNKNEK